MKSLLFKNFSWSFIGSSIYALSQWILIITIMRVGSPHDAGVYSLGLALSAPIIMLINLNFRAMQSTDLSIRFGFNAFKVTRILGNALFFCVFLIILAITNYNIEIATALVLIALIKIIESFSDLYYGLFQYNERLDLVAKSTILRGVLGTLLFGFGYYIFKDLSLALVLMLVMWTLNLIFFDIKNGKYFLKEMQSEAKNLKIKSLIKIGLPIGLVSFIASLNVNIPRLVFEQYLTLEDLGYFTAIFYLVLVIGKFMTSLSSATLPRMANLYENGNLISFFKIFKLIMFLLMFFSSLTIMISYFWGSELLLFVYGEDYYSLNILLILIMIYGLFNYLGFAFEIGLNAMKKYEFRLYIEIFVTLAVIFSSIYFIPNFGLNGGAIALIISAIFKTILLTVLFMFKYKALNIKL
ncbi:oligosaccharide flippase family protein [Bacillus sp. H-16]|uniref:oligosaccharide flippase family protein n=1 Tax=Alteribacter salitolerans TaxID=2912333 RepID=UPI0019627D25|nr:oligosaccharide flippase family protein [Alteribacter salitolerans]MBM7095680.1 oligosaccharide flippase family protein [Alteribacter salitolerans]